MYANALNQSLFQIIESELVHGIDIDSINNLISEGANVNSSDEHGNPLLFIALKCASTRTVRVLLQSGANPDCWNQNGDSLLSLAAEIDADNLSNCDTLRLLLKFGANINLVNGRNQNVLWDAVSTGVRKTVKYLLQKGADATALDSNGYTLLHHLAEQKYGTNFHNRVEYISFFIKCTRLLMSHGAYFSQNDLKSDTILEKFLEFGAKPEVEIFIHYWINGVRNVENPLHLAACNPRTIVLLKLLDSNFFDANAKDSCGTRPIHVATRCGNVENLKLLLKRGADPNVFTKWNGETPFLIASRDGNGRFIRILEYYGARSPTDYEEEMYLFNDGASEWLSP